MPHVHGLIAFIAALAVCAAAQPLVVSWSRLVGRAERVSGRSSYRSEVSRVGGLAMLAGIVAGALASGASAGWLGGQLAAPSPVWIGAGVGIVTIALAGLLDDLLRLGTVTKLLLQLIAAAAAVDAGLRIDTLVLPGGATLESGVLAPAITILWILLVTNAISVTDGLEGLSGGLALVALLAIGPAAWMLGGRSEFVACCVLAGAVLGSLRYNLPPVSILMGDLGGQLLGFSLAVLTVRLLQVGTGAPIGAAVAGLAVGLPVLDLLLTVLRRARLAVRSEGWSPRAILRQVGSRDRRHLHFILLDAGIAPRKALIAVLGLAALLAGGGWLLATPGALIPGLLVCAAAAGILLHLRRRAGEL
jgi:UDP-GlcNAc:undecaprenyl-phosphate GlcNAc-1-phosphate transferase